MEKKAKLTTFYFLLILLSSFFPYFNGLNEPTNSIETENVKSSSTPSNAFDWYMLWGGSQYDLIEGIGIDSSDNIYVAGYQRSFGAGNFDFFLIKYNNTGSEEWNRTWGGSGDDSCYDMAIDSLGNVYLAGYTYSYGAGDYDMCLVKYDGAGNFQWYRTWGTSSSDTSMGVTVDSAGYIYIVGDSYTGSSFDFCIVKYNNTGDEQWSQTWGGTDFDTCTAVTLDISGNIYIIGFTGSYGAGGWDYYVAKLNNAGVVQWEQTWGGTDDERAYAIALDSAKNVYITGYTESFGAGNRDICLVKYNNSGAQEFNRTWGDYRLDACESIIIDSDEIFLAGNTYSFGAEQSDCVILKYNTLGDMEWEMLWGDVSYENCRDMAIDSQNNLFLGGGTQSFGATDGDTCLVKFGVDTDLDGLSDWQEINTYFTNPIVNDTDSDDLLDGEEINVYSTNPNDNDSDNDFILDGEEVIPGIDGYITDPNDDDSDDDLLLDGYEITNSTDPLDDDSDDDELLDGIEIITYNTNPLKNDTDDDLMLDKWEVDNLLNPLVNDSGLDPDVDLLINILEFQHNTDPWKNDTDDDLMPDKWEVDNLLNPLVNDSASDPDADLLINIIEFQHNTDPQNNDTDGDSWSDGDEVLVYNTDPLDPERFPKPPEPFIPGYNIFVIIGVIFFGTLVLVMKKKNV
ncbi:MAG: SBBP repeat-containing protein [Candidatus Hodarchaeota archaeon]